MSDQVDTVAEPLELLGDAMLMAPIREGLADIVRALPDQARPWRSYAALQLWAHARALVFAPHPGRNDP